MAKEALKVLVRLLPPEITEDELVATVPQAHLEHTTWRNFQAGKRYKGEAKPSINGRCYFLFDSEENAEKFIKDYHGHQFVDGQGESFRAVACFAPYPKVPRQKASKDQRDGTIFEDATYKQFVESLSAPKTFEAPPDPVAALQPATAKDTPLLNYMKTRAAERRARQEKRERERKRWHDRLGRIEEKPKWRCAECGTSKHLEEDPDQRGVCYCTYCWETWEAKEYKKKKKSKNMKRSTRKNGMKRNQRRRKRKRKAAMTSGSQVAGMRKVESGMKVGMKKLRRNPRRRKRRRRRDRKKRSMVHVIGVPRTTGKKSPEKGERDTPNPKGRKQNKRKSSGGKSPKKKAPSEGPREGGVPKKQMHRRSKKDLAEAGEKKRVKVLNGFRSCRSTELKPAEAGSCRSW